MDDFGRAFLDRSAAYLTRDFLPRLRGAVETMGPEDLWWRPNEASNSVGNLLLHLAGNLRQWVVHGVGGADDVRTRAREFAADAGPSREELLDELTAVVHEASSTLERLDPAALGQPRTIQGNEVTVMEAIYHAVEHFSMHTGQIIWIVKARTDRDLGFYRVEGGVAEATWITEPHRPSPPDGLGTSAAEH
jgi:uncharacterized damage-inducible protein DinB